MPGLLQCSVGYSDFELIFLVENLYMPYTFRSAKNSKNNLEKAFFHVLSVFLFYKGFAERGSKVSRFTGIKNR